MMVSINKIYNMNCLDGMKLMDDNYIDTVITDSPYGFRFMGKKWDYDVPSIEIWSECLRVLKPGGYLLSFCGTRTQHRMACNIEDAGFEIRDIICWIFSQGFPKSLNISKSIDKLKNAEREVIGISKNKSGIADGNLGKQSRDTDHAWSKGKSVAVHYPITKASTPEAQQWDGYGTALKPAMELITIAMKPIKGTFAENALKFGVAGLNIDDARIPLKGERPKGSGNPAINTNCYGDYKTKVKSETPSQGRYPSNVILDETSAKLLDQQAPKTGQLAPTTGKEPSASTKNQIYGDYSMVAGKSSTPRDKLSGASRFYYCPKASKSERNAGCDNLKEKQIPYQDYRENVNTTNSYVSKYPDGSSRPMNKPRNNHPTVKPLKLMEYLCKLTRPPNGGIVLDPFIGSGTTAIACKRTNRNYIGFEKDPDYYKIAKARIKATTTLQDWM